MGRRDYNYVALEDVERLLSIAERDHVSKVARGPHGFLAAYRDANGSRARLPDSWRARRRTFLALHLAAAKFYGERWWTPGGEPSRRHLALIVWAYTPTAERLRAYLKAKGPERATKKSVRGLRPFFDKAVAYCLAHEMANADLTPPKLVLESGESKTRWGGKFEPGAQPIVRVYPAASLPMNRAITLHELGHWVRHHTGDPRGEHDRAFCVVTSRLYRHFHVSDAAAAAVERVGGCLS